MRQSLLRSLALLVLGVLLVAPAHAGDVKANSPEDTFKAFAAAFKKEDVKAAMSYLSRDSQSAVAGFMVIMAWWGERSDSAGEEGRKAFEDALKRHGLSDAMQKIPKVRDASGEVHGYILAGEMVKDKPAFVKDVLELAAKYLGWDVKVPKEGETSINDVKIDGEQAKGQVTNSSAGGKGTTGTLYFKLENGVWKIDGLETYLKMQPPPAPAPPAQVQPRVQPEAPPSYSRPGLLRRLLDRLRNW